MSPTGWKLRSNTRPPDCKAFPGRWSCSSDGRRPRRNLGSPQHCSPLPRPRAGAGPDPQTRLVHDQHLRRARAGAHLRGHAHHRGLQGGDGHRRGPRPPLVPEKVSEAWEPEVGRALQLGCEGFPLEGVGTGGLRGCVRGQPVFLATDQCEARGKTFGLLCLQRKEVWAAMSSEDRKASLNQGKEKAWLCQES